LEREGSIELLNGDRAAEFQGLADSIVLQDQLLRVHSQRIFA